MTQAPEFSRRRLLGVAAALPLAAPALGLGARPALAKAAMLGAAQPAYQRFSLGSFEVTTLLAATRPVESPHQIFGLNASAEDFEAVSRAAFLPTDVAQFFFTPTVVNTGAELVLFDTGTDPAGLVAALAQAGYQPGDVDIVVITHMHPDHIGGMVTDGAATFANARYVTGAVEHNFWSGAGNALFDTNMRPFAERTTFLDDGGTITGGITAMAAFGHTPGHMAVMLESDGKGLVLAADTANHYIWSLAHPDWEVRFDADKAAAAATRHRLLGMIAADRLPFVGYHMPFPGLGFIEAAGAGFRYVPASYQMMLAG
ncbi:MAG: MBL fold metallo-hydrolase [Alphaproteobacteria bacterium HGW-Alphaproteobacteria-6]|nr:MAG: MBL fold metallo-hydrolase [Alphaproteobacteria bacterium HGW-Alphaproteobacteria-6]